MSLTLAAAGLIGAGIGGLTNLAGNIASNVVNVKEAKKTRDFNREEAEKNRQFQKEMAQNNIKYAVDQAKELGISPSLVLGDQTTALGGSQASASGGQGHVDTTGITSATSGILNAINENNRLKTMEEMNEDRLQTMKDIQNMKMGNSTTSKFDDYAKRNGYNSKEDLIKDLTNLDNFQI